MQNLEKLKLEPKIMLKYLNIFSKNPEIIKDFKIFKQKFAKKGGRKTFSRQMLDREGGNWARSWKSFFGVWDIRNEKDVRNENSHLSFIGMIAGHMTIERAWQPAITGEKPIIIRLNKKGPITGKI